MNEALDPTQVGPGGWAALTFFGLLIAVFFLFRSLRKQLNKVDFTETPAEPPADPAEPGEQR